MGQTSDDGKGVPFPETLVYVLSVQLNLWHYCPFNSWGNRLRKYLAQGRAASVCDGARILSNSKAEVLSVSATCSSLNGG